MGRVTDGLQIKQVALQTGLSEQLIRKWEQRYQAVMPKRLENGYRLYSKQDVDRLLTIKQMVADGTTVRRAVGLAEQAASATRQPLPVMSQHDSPDDLHADRDTKAVEKLLAAGSQGDVQRLEGILQRCDMTVGLRAVVETVIVPFLQSIGELWIRGQWSEDQEHLSSLTVRNFLVRRSADLPDAPQTAPTLLASCVPGERHDIMLHAAMIEARKMGWKTLFLGPEPAPGAIERAVSRMRPNMVLLSITTLHPPLVPDSGGTWFAQLDAFAAQFPETQFCVGGPSSVVQLCVGGLQRIRTVQSVMSLLTVLEDNHITTATPQ